MSVVKSTYKFIFYPLALVVTVVTLLILIQPSGEYYRNFTEYAVEIMLGILGFGLLCLLLQWHRLMFVSFACAGILSLFLKSSTNPAPVYATPIENEDIEVIQVNTSSNDGAYENLTKLLLSTDADLISIQEVNPGWDEALKKDLSKTYQYSHSVVSMGFNGMAIYSKLPLTNIDAFYHNDIPNLTGLIKPKKEGAKPIRFISTYTNPTFGTDKAYQELKEHFEAIIAKVKDTDETMLAFGNYNTVAWSSEMKFFTGELGLQNSRRTVNPFSGTTFEHIFHSMDMECVDFDGLYDNLGERIGLKVKLHQIEVTPLPSYPHERPTQ